MRIRQDPTQVNFMTGGNEVTKTPINLTPCDLMGNAGSHEQRVQVPRCLNSRAYLGILNTTYGENNTYNVE